MLKALAELIAAAGLEHPEQIEARHVMRRTSETEVRMFSQLHHFLAPGELLEGRARSEFYTGVWAMARADSFAPAA